jgi:hypothetical protein
MAREGKGRVWEEVRRALGRLVSQVDSHAISADRLSATVRVKHSVGTRLPQPSPGSRFEDWQPASDVYLLPSPDAADGGDGVNLASVATVISGNGAFGASDVVVSTAACGFDGEGACRLGMTGELPPVPPIHGRPVRIEAAMPQRSAVAIGTPGVKALSFMPIALSKQGGAAPRWKIGSIRTQSSLGAAMQVPMTRQRLVAPAGISPDVAFGAERRALAQAAGAEDSDVTLLGIFPRVPLGAVKKLTMAPDGAELEIWLKPEAAGRSVATKAATVLLGRQRSTGKMLQTIRRGSDGNVE